MHELGIVFHIIDTVEQVGRENGVTRKDLPHGWKKAAF